MNNYLRLNNKTIKELILCATELCYVTQTPHSPPVVEKLRHILQKNFIMKIPRNYNDGSTPAPKPDFEFLLETGCFGGWDMEDLSEKVRLSDIYEKIWDKEPENE